MVWALGEPEAPGRAELWTRRVERALERDGASVVTDTDSWATEASGFDARMLETIEATELLLFLARTRASDLDERGALSALIEAERRAEGAIAFAGGMAWYAEVEVQLAIAAFQLGHVELARAALERAATLDPLRRVRPAEGPPALVELAGEVVRAVRSAPVSTFMVRVLDADTVRAQVYVDDEYVGPAPVRVRTSAGLHALRIEAPGRRSWASLSVLLPGTRADVEVQLSLEPPLVVARALAEEVRRGQLAAIPARVAELRRLGVAPDALVLVTVGDGAFDRAALVVCDESACRVTRRLEGEAPARLSDVSAEEVAALDDARTWLDEIPDLEGAGTDVDGPFTGWWEEPWPWIVLGGVAVGVGVGVTAGVLSGTPSNPQITVIIPTLEPR